MFAQNDLSLDDLLNSYSSLNNITVPPLTGSFICPKSLNAAIYLSRKQQSPQLFSNFQVICIIIRCMLVIFSRINVH